MPIRERSPKNPKKEQSGECRIESHMIDCTFLSNRTESTEPELKTVSLQLDIQIYSAADELLEFFKATILNPSVIPYGTHIILLAGGGVNQGNYVHRTR